MSAKHTPGPWTAHHDHGWLVVESSNGDMLIKIEKGSAAKKHMADAILIAAAPDLLEALKACDEAMSYMSEYDIPITLPAQVKAAISKAIG